jgi:hypothetical protein
VELLAQAKTGFSEKLGFFLVLQQLDGRHQTQYVRG